MIARVIDKVALLVTLFALVGVVLYVFDVLSLDKFLAELTRGVFWIFGTATWLDAQEKK